MEKHPGAVHVIDDCEQLFSERSALTLLRSALGGETVNGHRERRVSYSISGSHARVLEHYFYGAIIFTMNRQLSDERPEIQAVMSRIPCVGFAPPDHEIRALMRDVARRGFIGKSGNMTPRECVEVVEYVIQCATKLECRLDLRWIEHGYGHYLTQVADGGTVDWRDMVKFHVMRTLTYFDHPTSANSSGKPKTEAAGQLSVDDEIVIALGIAETPGLTRDEKLRLWEERTGLSRATYYRRIDAGRKNRPGE